MHRRKVFLALGVAFHVLMEGMITILKTNSPEEAFTLKVIGIFAILGGGAFTLHALGTVLSFQEAGGHNIVRSQLWGLGEILCLYFVLLPLMAVAGGSLRESTSSWFSAWLGGLFLGVGGICLVPAVLFARLEYGWMFAMTHPGETGQVSPWQMLGILFAGFGVMWMMLRQIQVSWTRWRKRGCLADLLFGSAAGLVSFGMPLVASVAFYALKIQLLGFAMLDPDASVTFYMGGLPYAAALGMFHVAALLTVFGVLIRQAAPKYRPSMFTTKIVGLIPVLGLFAPELRVIPQDLPDMWVLSAMFTHCLLLAVWWVAIWRVLIEIQEVDVTRVSIRWCVAGGMLSLGIALGLFLNLLTLSGVHVLGGWVFLQRVALGSGVFLGCWMAILPLKQDMRPG